MVVVVIAQQNPICRVVYFDLNRLMSHILFIHSLKIRIPVKDPERSAACWVECHG